MLKGAQLLGSALKLQEKYIRTGLRQLEVLEKQPRIVASDSVC